MSRVRKISGVMTRVFEGRLIGVSRSAEVDVVVGVCVEVCVGAAISLESESPSGP